MENNQDYYANLQKEIIEQLDNDINRLKARNKFLCKKIFINLCGTLASGYIILMLWDKIF